MNKGDCVRVVKVPDRPQARLGSAPQVGDVGVIRHIIAERPQGRLLGYIVERLHPDGTFAWVADFMPDEVEAV